MILLTLSACNVSFNNEGDVASNNHIGGRGTGSSSGPCALWDIVGKYEDGVEVTADCSIIDGAHTMVIDDPDTNEPIFYNRQLIWGNWVENQVQDQCWVQYVNEELFVDCWNWEYRGFREE